MLQRCGSHIDTKQGEATGDFAVVCLFAVTLDRWHCYKLGLHCAQCNCNSCWI